MGESVKGEFWVKAAERCEAGFTQKRLWIFLGSVSKTSNRRINMAKNIINEIRKNTRRKFSADEKIRVAVEGLRGEIPISELCRREKISPSQYYKWSKQFLEAGKVFKSLWRK